MNKWIIFGLLIFFGMGALAQSGMPKTAIKQIKIGNTYRETNQYAEAEKALHTGLEMVRTQKDAYWEAVACENLGLLYRDMEDSMQAVHFFENAMRMYGEMNMTGSKLAMMQLAESVRKGGDLYAGIDIGSTGIKMSLIQVTLGREGRYIYNSTHDTAINSNFADLNSSAFESGKGAIKNFFTYINGKKIGPDHIFIAFSSGILQSALAKQMSTDSIARVFGQVARSIIPSFIKPIEFLTPDLEARYTNTGIVLPKFKERSVSIDIGGSNTKGGFYNPAGAFESFSLPYGSRSMAISTTSNELPESIKSEMMLLNQKPGIQNKREVFFLGGIVWAMINLLYPEKAKADYVEFTYNDVETFKSMASADYINLINFTQEKLNSITDKDLMEKAKANFTAVQSTFTADNLRRGAMLLDGIMNQLNIPTLKKRYYFLSRGSHIAWVTGYVVTNISEKYKSSIE
ncbi:MAG: tetratricopeptide repeat protein [Chitinophagaceae bacterium]